MIKSTLERYLKTYSFVKVIDHMMDIEFYSLSSKIHLREIFIDFKCYDLIIEHEDFETLYKIDYIEETEKSIILKDNNDRAVQIEGITFKKS